MSAKQAIVDLALRNEPDYPSDPETGHGLYGDGEYEAHLNKLLDAYAHELAEKIRNWDGPRSVEERWAVGASDAADLIDPEVSS